MPNHEFKLQSSKTYIFLILSMSIASMCLTFFIEMNLLLKLLLFFFIVLQGVWTFRRQVLFKTNWAILAIHYQHPNKTSLEISPTLNHDLTKEQSGWRLQFRDQSRFVKLRGDSIVTQFFSLLRFELAGQIRPKSCLVFPDSLSPGQYRKLLVILRMS